MQQKIIIEAIKEASRRLGTQAALSNKTGIPQGRISDYLGGRYDVLNMTLKTFHKIFPELEIKFFNNEDGDKPCSTLEKFCRLAGTETNELWRKIETEIVKLQLDIFDPPTNQLLLYWRDMPVSKRFEMLARAAEIEEKIKAETKE